MRLSREQYALKTQPVLSIDGIFEINDEMHRGISIREGRSLIDILGRYRVRVGNIFMKDIYKDQRCCLLVQPPLNYVYFENTRTMLS